MMALSGRVGIAASLLFPLVFCFSPVLPSKEVVFTAPSSTLSSFVLTSGAAKGFFRISAAFAAPTGSAPDGPANEQTRAERLLKYAEQRAENAEEELKRFRETHESSIRACGEASQRKQRELESCQEQSESFRKMYNSLQVTKSTLEKEVLSLQSQLAVANAAAGTESSADKSAASDESAKLRAEVKKLQEKLEDMEDEHASEIAALQGKVRELLVQRELLRQQGGGPAQGERYFASLSALKTVLVDVGKLYQAIGEQLLGLIPVQWWESAASMKMEAEMFASPYTNAVYEKLCVPLKPYYEYSKGVFFSRIYPLCEAAGHRAAAAAKTVSDDVMPAINARLDVALKPIFTKHPDVEYMIPTGLGDRLAVFGFVLIITYFVALISFRYVLFPVVGFLLPCASFCGKRRSNSRGSVSTSKRSGGSGISSSTASGHQKRFIPSGTSADSGACAFPSGHGGSGSKKAPQHTNPTRPFPFTEKCDNAPINMKKV